MGDETAGAGYDRFPAVSSRKKLSTPVSVGCRAELVVSSLVHQVVEI